LVSIPGFCSFDQSVVRSDGNSIDSQGEHISYISINFNEIAVKFINDSNNVHDILVNLGNFSVGSKTNESIIRCGNFSEDNVQYINPNCQFHGTISYETAKDYSTSRAKDGSVRIFSPETKKWQYIDFDVQKLAAENGLGALVELSLPHIYVDLNSDDFPNLINIVYQFVDEVKQQSINISSDLTDKTSLSHLKSIFHKSKFHKYFGSQFSGAKFSALLRFEGVTVNFPLSLRTKLSSLSSYDSVSYVQPFSNNELDGLELNIGMTKVTVSNIFHNENYILNQILNYQICLINFQSFTWIICEPS
jgi:hypothetical protein